MQTSSFAHARTNSPLSRAEANGDVCCTWEEIMIKRLKDYRVKFLTYLSIVGLLLGSFVFPAYAAEEKTLTAFDIIFNAEERYEGETSVSDATMVLINSKKEQRVRQYIRYRKDVGPDGKDEKSMTFFLSPPDLKNTAYLSFDWNDEAKDDDSWLYLPGLKKVKRLASSDKSDAFMGSDFTYTDLQTATRQYWDFTLLQETDPVDGHDCWVIEGTPKEGQKKKVLQETGYTKIQVWVRKDIFVKVKGKFWAKKGNRLKYYKASKIEQIADVWTPQELQMVTTKKGKVEHTTVIRTDKIEYNRKIDDSFFTQQKMEAGL